jgi:Cyclic nucleotide-binding domain/FHA domain
MVQRRTFSKDDVIVVEGSQTSDAYIIERGTVEVFRTEPVEQRLAVLGRGEIFGEMALITEQLRSASVRALEEVHVTVIDREAFLVALRTNPEAVLPVFRVMCERIRTLSSLVLELSQLSAASREAVVAHLAGDIGALPGDTTAAASTAAIVIEGLTPEARESLAGRRVTVEHFPYRVGRTAATDDPLAGNDLAIRDDEPYHVSRSHCAIVGVGERCFVIDRGSQLGTVVNGTLIGSSQRATRAELRVGDNEIGLGGLRTPYRYRIGVTAAPAR